MLKIIKNAYYRIPNPEFPIPTKQLQNSYNILISQYHNLLIMNWLDLDYAILKTIHAHHAALLDAFIPYLRNPVFWCPLYVFLLVVAIRQFQRKAMYWVLALVLTVGVADIISSSVIKPIVHRLRPCNTIFLQKDVTVLVPCGVGYSFPSAHAANHFAIAGFVTGTLFRRNKWLWWLWASSVAFAQVYVGVHFPLDVLGGALLGVGIGALMVFFWIKLCKLSA
jgi:membrane-associated phospholipid phosphatase